MAHFARKVLRDVPEVVLLLREERVALPDRQSQHLLAKAALAPGLFIALEQRAGGKVRLAGEVQCAVGQRSQQVSRGPPREPAQVEEKETAQREVEGVTAQEVPEGLLVEELGREEDLRELLEQRGVLQSVISRVRFVFALRKGEVALRLFGDHFVQSRARLGFQEVVLEGVRLLGFARLCRGVPLPRLPPALAAPARERLRHASAGVELAFGGGLAVAGAVRDAEEKGLQVELEVLLQVAVEAGEALVGLQVAFLEQEVNEVREQHVHAALAAVFGDAREGPALAVLLFWSGHLFCGRVRLKSPAFRGTTPAAAFRRSARRPFGRRSRAGRAA